MNSSHSSDFENHRTLRSVTSLNLIVRRTEQTTYGDRAFTVAGPRFWNSLSPHVKSASSVNIFKTRLKTFICSHSLQLIY